MARIELSHLRKTYGPVIAVKDLSIVIEDGIGPANLLGEVHPDKAVRDAAEPCLQKFNTLNTELFRDGAFAWSFSTLSFHHFDAAGNRRVIAEMRRVARAGAAIVDLRRSPLLAPLLRVLQPLLGASAVTRHDGQVSAAAWAPTNAPPACTQPSSRRRGSAPSSPLVFRNTTAFAPRRRAAVS